MYGLRITKGLRILSLTLLLLHLSPISVVLQNPDKSPDLAKVKSWNRAAQYDSTIQYLVPLIDSCIQNKIVHADLIRGMSFLLDAKRQKGEKDLTETIQRWKSSLAGHEKEYLACNLLDFEYLTHILRTQGYYPAMEFNLGLEIKTSYISEVPDLYAFAHCLKAFIMMLEGEYHQALMLTHRADSIYRSHYDTTDIEYVTILNNYGAIYGNIGQYSLAMAFAKRTFEIIQKHYDQSTINYVTSLNNLSTASWESGEYQQAVELLKSAIELNEKNERLELLVSNYYNIQAPLLAMGDYEQAYNYMQLALTTFRSKSMEDPYMEFHIVKSIVSYYLDMGKYDAATQMMNELKNLTDRWFSDTEYMQIQYKLLMANFYRQTEKSDLALKMYNECLPYYIENYGKWSGPTGNIYYFMGELQSDIGNFGKALTYLKEARHSYQAYFGSDHPRVYETSYALANNAAKMGNRTTAFEYLSEILGGVNASYKHSPKIPTLEALPSFLYLEDAIGLKAELLSQAINPDSLLIGIKFFLLLDSAYHQLSVRYGGLDKRDDLRTSASTWYRKAVSLAHKLFQITGSQDWLELGYYFSEKVRYLRMQEILRKKNALNFGDVPEELLAKELQLRKHLSNLRSQINDISRSDSIVYFGLMREIFQNERLYQHFLQKLEIAHPKYYELKYQSNVVGIEDIRETLLHEGEQLVQYCLNKDELFIHVIGSTKSSFTRVELPEDFEELVYSWFGQISTAFDQDISSKSHQIYKVLIEPVFQYLEEAHMVIVPDLYLHYVSFDALSSYQSKSGYLMENFAIRYAYSPTTLVAKAQAKSEGDYKYSWIGFVPDFGLNATSARYLGLTRLPWAERLGKKIRKLFDGKLWTGKQASLYNFNKIRDRTGILHFGTHAIVNDQNPLESFLALHGEDSNYHKLTADDIFNMDLQADLVVLTACQTAKGKILAGEGMMSLARAFEYAGSKNIVSTLWSIDDQQTTKIMEKFYQRVAIGIPPQVALRESKIWYLTEHAGLLAHPFYWAGLQFSGEFMALNLPGSRLESYKIILAFGGLIILFILIWYTFRQKLHRFNKSPLD